MARLGLITAIGSGPQGGDVLERVDQTDRLFIGGGSTVRGYHENGIDDNGTAPCCSISTSMADPGQGIVSTALFRRRQRLWHLEEVRLNRMFSPRSRRDVRRGRHALFDGTGVRASTPIDPVRLRLQVARGRVGPARGPGSVDVRSLEVHRRQQRRHAVPGRRPTWHRGRSAVDHRLQTGREHLRVAVGAGVRRRRRRHGSDRLGRSERESELEPNLRRCRRRARSCSSTARTSPRPSSSSSTRPARHPCSRRRRRGS